VTRRVSRLRVFRAPMPKLPSEKLRSLASSNKAKEFKRILETDLYPFLDRLPAAQQKSLLDILNNNTCNKNEAADLVGFNTRSKSISAGLKALVESVDSDWKQGWERQVGSHFRNALMTHLVHKSVCYAGGDDG
jgi:hypothetical protein